MKYENFEFKCRKLKESKAILEDALKPQEDTQEDSEMFYKKARNVLEGLNPENNHVYLAAVSVMCDLDAFHPLADESEPKRDLSYEKFCEMMQEVLSAVENEQSVMARIKTYESILNI